MSDKTRERIAKEAWLGVAYPDRRHDARHTEMLDRAWLDQNRNSEFLDLRVQAAWDTADRVLAALREGEGERERLELLDGGARFKLGSKQVGGVDRAVFPVTLPHELIGRWVALVDATDNRHLRSTPPAPTGTREPPDPITDPRGYAIHRGRCPDCEGCRQPNCGCCDPKCECAAPARATGEPDADEPDITIGQAHYDRRYSRTTEVE